jgi:hypothetical protein
MELDALYPYSPDIHAEDVQHLPKSDNHVHAESTGRLTQVIEHRRGLTPYSHRAAVERVLRESPPGMERLLALNSELREVSNTRTGTVLFELYERPDYVEAFLELLMEEEAANGSLLAELRMGGEWPLFPHFLSCFRSAEQRAQSAIQASAPSRSSPGL